MKADRAPPSPRTATRVAEPTKPSEPLGPLRFDFAERAVGSQASPSVLPRSFAGVKRSILRWLEKEL